MRPSTRATGAWRHAAWLVLGLAGLPGCTDPLFGGGAETAQAPEQTGQEDAPDALASMLAEGEHPFAHKEVPTNEGPVVIIQISFDVLRARVSRGAFSESGKIWNHLDEEAIPADTALLLQRNGLRIARGHESAWPPIKALLEQEPRVETSQGRIISGNGEPLRLAIDQQPRDQTLFLFRADGSLGGATYPASTNAMRIDYAPSLQNADSVLLAVAPQIELPRREPPLVQPPSAAAREAYRKPTRVLAELAFNVEIGPQQFLVIGPSPVAGKDHLAGTLLLCEEVEGRATESICFITPRVLRTSRFGG